MENLRTKIIACQTVGEELKALLPNDFEMEMLEYGLHNIPEKLHAQLQAAIDNTGPEYGTILIGYGMCANAIVGIQSRRFRLVIPKADDYITLYLGSREEYLRQLDQAPGTFYLTKGWIEEGKSPLGVYEEYCRRYPRETAEWVIREELKNYTRIALVETELGISEAHRKHALENARFLT